VSRVYKGQDVNVVIGFSAVSI